MRVIVAQIHIVLQVRVEEVVDLDVIVRHVHQEKRRQKVHGMYHNVRLVVKENTM